MSKKKPEEIEKLYLEGNESVVSLLNDRDYIAAIDRMNLVSKNIASMEPYDFHKVSSVAETLIGDLKKVILFCELSMLQEQYQTIIVV